MTGAQTSTVTRLVLSDFRSYASLDLGVGGKTVVVTGENGSGKTNLIEAVSLFSQGRGLRRADLLTCARRGGSGGFAASLDLADADGTVRFGTGIEPTEGSVPARRFRVDREPVGSARFFAERLRLVWLTPAMDGLFTGPPSERRRFLDRLVLAIDAEHGSRVAALERAQRQRNRLLADYHTETAWLDAVEREVAELAVAVSAARAETVTRLAPILAAGTGAFPHARIELVGSLETLCASVPALEAEDRYRLLLRRGRAADAAAGRTLVGSQTADLQVTHGPKAMDAHLCSTGEQKALLVGLVLGHARLVAHFSGRAPVVLLDEIAAHFDAERRAALFAEFDRLSGQVWMTGADPHAFCGVEPGSTHLRVTSGRVEAD